MSRLAINGEHSMSSKTYVGDSVYADIDTAGAVVLTTENGIEATNTIVLEPEVLAVFLRWVRENDLA
jgi:hypothetical protein